MIKIKLNGLLFSSIHFQSLINLRELYLDNNNLHTIENAVFTTTEKLEILHLQSNHLSDRYNNSLNFGTFYKLSTINLAQNELTKIPEITSSYVKSIDLSYNKIAQYSITDIDLFAYTQSYDEYISINLSGNVIRTINFTYLTEQHKWSQHRFGTKTVELYLDFINLTCDCDILDFLNFILTQSRHKHLIFVFHIERLACSTPQPFAGKPILEIKPNDLTCSFEQCPIKCLCLVEPNRKVLTINCSNLNATAMPVLQEFGQQFNAIKLFIENNDINELSSIDRQTGYINVTEIFARNNSLTVISSTNLPPELKLLDLRANRLIRLETSAINVLNGSTKLKHLMLSENAWQCDCNASALLTYAQSHSTIISDLNETQCVNKDNRMLITFSIADLCEEYDVVITISFVIASIIGLLIGTMVALYYKYREELKVWLYANNCCLQFITEDDLDKDKIYDAFLSYSHKDVYFVLDLMNVLEKEPYSFKLCLHDRDWMPGEFITDSVSKQNHSMWCFMLNLRYILVQKLTIIFYIGF